MEEGKAVHVHPTINLGKKHCMGMLMRFGAGVGFTTGDDFMLALIMKPAFECGTLESGYA
jgi:hypothetical protein